MPLKVFSWKFSKSWRKPVTLRVIGPARIFHADFIGVVDFRIELQVADQRLGAAGRGEVVAKADDEIGDLSADRSRLKPPAL